MVSEDVQHESSAVIKIPPRPRPSDLVIRAEAAEALWPEIKEWLANVGNNAEEDKEDVFDVLAKSYNAEDGYKLARELEDKAYFDPDGELVGLLESYGSHISRAHDKALTAWVRTNQITPRYSNGDFVIFRGAFGKEVAGEVIGTDRHRGTYTMCVPSEGHVREGMGIHGFVIDYEKVVRKQEKNEPVQLQSSEG